MYSDNNNEVIILTLLIMTLSVNTSATTTELVNEALTFSKYGNDIEAVAYINEVLEELKYRMSNNQFTDFCNRINTMLNA